MTITEYKIIKSFNKEVGNVQHTIIKEGCIIYDISFMLPNSGESPLTPIDVFEAAINGEQITITPQYHQELQNIAFELHLLNACKTNDEKQKLTFVCKLKNAIKRIISIFT